MAGGRLSWQVRETRAGNSYTADEEADLGNDSTLNILVDNPTDSGYQLVAVGIRISRENQVAVRLLDQVTDVSGGTDSELVNNLMGAGNPSVASATRGVTYTEVSVHQGMTLYGSGSDQYLQEGELVVPEGGHFLLELVNEGGTGNNDVAARVTFYQI